MVVKTKIEIVCGDSGHNLQPMAVHGGEGKGGEEGRGGEELGEGGREEGWREMESGPGASLQISSLSDVHREREGRKLRSTLSMTTVKKSLRLPQPVL